MKELKVFRSNKPLLEPEQWNPVKELKVVRAPCCVDTSAEVESGEGIESQPPSPVSIRPSTVESGEGIERPLLPAQMNRYSNSCGIR